MDNKKKAIDALTSLANSNVNKRSDAAKLREVFRYVELALSSGVSRVKVLETIRDTLGVDMSLKAFDKNLYRIRKKQKSENLKETTKPGEENNTGSKQLIASSDTAPETTSSAVPTEQNTLAIIHEDEDNDEGVQTAFQPHDLKKIWSEPPNMAELRAIGKELYKKQKEDAKK